MPTAHAQLISVFFRSDLEKDSISVDKDKLTMLTYFGKRDVIHSLVAHAIVIFSGA